MKINILKVPGGLNLTIHGDKISEKYNTKLLKAE